MKGSIILIFLLVPNTGFIILQFRKLNWCNQSCLNLFFGCFIKYFVIYRPVREEIIRGLADCISTHNLLLMLICIKPLYQTALILWDSIKS